MSAPQQRIQIAPTRKPAYASAGCHNCAFLRTQGERLRIPGACDKSARPDPCAITGATARRRSTSVQCSKSSQQRQAPSLASCNQRASRHAKRGRPLRRPYFMKINKTTKTADNMLALITVMRNQRSRCMMLSLSGSSNGSHCDKTHGCTQITTRAQARTRLRQRPAPAKRVRDRRGTCCA
jgi:hypothetical protein